MLIKLVEIKQTSDAKKFTNETEKEYLLSEIFVNPEHIICMREDTLLGQQFSESKQLFPKNLDKRQNFTRLNLQRGQFGLDIAVVGSPKIISDKINENKKTSTG